MGDNRIRSIRSCLDWSVDLPPLDIHFPNKYLSLSFWMVWGIVWTGWSPTDLPWIWERRHVRRNVGIDACCKTFSRRASYLLYSRAWSIPGRSLSPNSHLAYADVHMTHYSSISSWSCLGSGLPLSTHFHSFSIWSGKTGRIPIWLHPQSPSTFHGLLACVFPAINVLSRWLELAFWWHWSGALEDLQHFSRWRHLNGSGGLKSMVSPWYDHCQGRQ